MPELLRMPEVAAGATSAVLSGWTVPENEAYAKDTVIAIIETDKAIVDLEAETDGRILRRLAAEGVEVAIGEPIALVAAPGETVDDVDGALAALGVAPASVGSSVPDPLPRHPGSLHRSLPLRRTSLPLVRACSPARSPVGWRAMQDSSSVGSRAAVPTAASAAAMSRLPWPPGRLTWRHRRPSRQHPLRRGPLWTPRRYRTRACVARSRPDSPKASALHRTSTFVAQHALIGSCSCEPS